MEKTSERLARALGLPLKNTVKWVALCSDFCLGNWTTVGQNKTLLSAIWEKGLLIGDIS
jgi:hypothetical protein